MKKSLFTLFLIFGFTVHAKADNGEIPNFSLMFHTGVEETNGFISGDQPAAELGIWAGVGISNRFDGFFGVDYYTMPNAPLTLNGPATSLLPGYNNPGTFVVQPTDDVALSVNTRWYPFNDKWDYIHRRYNTSIYLLGGMGIDLLVDPPPPTSGSAPEEFPILTNNYEILFGMNFGAGIDFPLDNGQEVSFYTEGLDHLIFWQGLTQVFDGRFGIRFMLDTAHVDPFR